MNKNFAPKFLRKYANLSEDIENAVKNFISDVRTSSFPNESEQY